jgi:hypothetical protein
MVEQKRQLGAQVRLEGKKQLHECSETELENLRKQLWQVSVSWLLRNSICSTADDPLQHGVICVKDQDLSEVSPH